MSRNPPSKKRRIFVYMLRKTLFDEQGGLCHWCKRMMTRGWSNKPLDVTVDHVIPRWRGGSNIRDNIVGACLECNIRRNKEDQPPKEYSTDVGKYNTWLETRSISSDH